jgi:hypothetical protein
MADTSRFRTKRQKGKNNNKNRIKSNKKYVHIVSTAGDILPCQPNDDVR